MTMKKLFSFNPNRHNFWPIYEAVKAYYPIGLKGAYPGIYYDYPGIKKLEALVIDNTHVRAHYRERWVKVKRKWQKELGKAIRETTYGQAPSFSGYVEVSRKKVDNCILSKELHVAVSFLGPFYTVFGLDNTVLIEEDRHYPQTNRVVISPTAGYDQYFSRLREAIEKDFSGHQFVPYFIHHRFIDGLRVRYRDDDENRVYHALFNENFAFSAPIVGDEYGYGMDQWLVDDPEEGGGWVVGPPGGIS